MTHFTLKKLFSASLSLAILAGLLAAAALPVMAAEQPPSSWAADAVNGAISLGLVPATLQDGYTKAATRAEFCALAVTLYETVRGEEIKNRKTFEDTSDVSVEKAAAIGVVSGTGGNRFSPDGQLTREQAATMLTLLSDVLGKPLAKQPATFADSGGISPWAAERVGQVQAAGIMGGTGGNKFSPKNPYTREQSIVTVKKLYDMVMNVTVPAETNFKAWALGCSAILATRNGYEPYQFGMFTKNDANESRAKTILSGSWGCDSREDLLETIARMTDGGHNTSFAEAYGIVSSLSDKDYQILLASSSETDKFMWPLTRSIGEKWGDKQIKAWDWFRMIHLAGWGYVAGYLDMQEAHDCMTPIIERLRKTFSSWEEASANYMDGYAWWSRTDVSQTGTEYKRRLNIYEQLKNYPPEKTLFDPSVWK